MDLSITDDLRNKIASKIPNIDLEIIQKSISIEIKADQPFQHPPDYLKEQSNKIYALNYFNDLVDLFGELRYSAISAECCLELLRNKEATIEDKSELGWRFKYYVDSAIYRCYSFWEYVGRFFNEYFDLKLDVNKKDLSKEKDIYFAREVLKEITKKYNHKLLIDIFELYTNSKEIFEYRIVKTHKRNTRIGEEILKITKEQTRKGRTLKIDVGKEYTGAELLRLLKKAYKNSRLALTNISIFFDIGHEEVVNESNEERQNSLIVIPDTKTIMQFQKIIKCNSLIIKK